MTTSARMNIYLIHNAVCVGECYIVPGEYGSWYICDPMSNDGPCMTFGSFSSPLFVYNYRLAKHF
jgi:hypothetical protein